MTPVALQTNHTKEMVATAQLAAQLLNLSGKLEIDVQPTVSQTNWGTSIYLQFRVGGEFFKVRYSDHTCLRSGEIECYDEQSLINWVCRFINPERYERKMIVTGRKSSEVNEQDMVRLVAENDGVVLSERVTSKGTIRYNVEFNETRLAWVRK